jgi:hypothetical protein
MLSWNDAALDELLSGRLQMGAILAFEKPRHTASLRIVSRIMAT